MFISVQDGLCGLVRAVLRHGSGPASSLLVGIQHEIAATHSASVHLYQVTFIPDQPAGAHTADAGMEMCQRNVCLSDAGG